MTMIKTKFLLLSSILKTRLDEVCPNVFIALRNILNCPDTVASAERSSENWRPSTGLIWLIKTLNRSHMTDSRLSSLAMLSIEASCMRTLDSDDVIRAYARQKTRSKPFWYYCTIMWHCLWYFHGYCYVIFFMCTTVPPCSDLFCFAVWLRSANWVALILLGGTELGC